MGAFDVKADDIITIRNPKWDAHESVRTRTTVLVADEEWVTNQLVKIKQDAQQQGNRAFRRQKNNMNMEAQLGAANRLWVFRMLVDWTFTKDGLPMPLSLESIKQLRGDYLDYIYEQIMKAQPKDEDTEQGEDEEDADPTLPVALHSINGATSRVVKAQSGENGTRNFLSKS